MTHYHVMSGLRGTKMVTTSIKFKDRMEGITTFIAMAKIIWAHLEVPPPHEEIKMNEKVSIIQMQDEEHRLVFAYCNFDNCDEDDHLELKLQL